MHGVLFTEIFYKYRERMIPIGYKYLIMKIQIESTSLQGARCNL